MTRNTIFKKVVTRLLASGAKKIVVFGSYARNEQTPKSDLDLIVRFSKKISLFDMVRIQQELADELRIPVDLLTEQEVSPYIKKYVRQEQMVLYP